jgi:hypothetical protein
LDDKLDVSGLVGADIYAGYGLGDNLIAKKICNYSGSVVQSADIAINRSEVGADIP